MMPVDGITVKRVLNAPAARVFAAWTRPDLMARWFFSGADWTAEVTSDLRVGGRYSVSMMEPGGARHVQSGEYRVIEPISRLVFTWSCPDLDVMDSLVTVELTERGKTTELCITHELLTDARIRGAHEEGWIACLGNLQKMLSIDEGNGPR